MTDFFQSGFERLGIRFFLVEIVPTTILVFILLTLYWSGAPGQMPDLQKVVSAFVTIEGTQISIIILSVFFIALILQNWNTAMVTVLEGYWGNNSLARAVKKPLLANHKKKMAQYKNWGKISQPLSELTDKEKERFSLAANRLRYHYPTHRELLPTSLGNIFRSFEEKAGGRYGLDTVAIWPRLYPLVSERLLEGINDCRNRLDLAVRIFWLSLIVTVVSFVVLVSYPIWLLVSLVMATVTILSHQQIKKIAISYGILIETAFDLHHIDLLKALHMALPYNIEEEIAANSKLSKDIVMGNFSDLKYNLK